MVVKKMKSKINMLPSLLLLLVLLYTATVTAEDTAYSVTITTVPSQGPFRIGPSVQFSCLIEPTPPDPVTFQWRRVEGVYGGGTHTQQNFSRSYYDDNLHYCYYLCEVSVNQTQLGSASRIVEVQGLLFTEAPVAQSFKHGGSLELNVNKSNDSYYARYISSLAWYHNGTELSSGSKYSISNNATRLRITGSDAGHYMVKIASVDYDSYNDPAECDLLVLPLLESIALHAPVTFTVQEDRVPAYDPSSIVSTLYVSDSNGPGTIELMKTVQLSYLSRFVRSYWYRNGTQITDGGMYSFTATSQELSLQITFNNTADVIGDYMGILWQDGYYLTDDIRSMCRGYYYYIRFGHFYFSRIPLIVTLWSVRLPSVHLHFDEPILSELETTTVECAIVGGEPVEALNLTLWRNEELLAHISGRNLSYLTTPHPYGTYRCSVGSVHNTSILLEKVNFQLLLDDDLLMEEQCQHQQQLAIDDLKAAIGGIFRTLCQSCDVYPSDIVDVQLNCSASGRFAYLTASLVYSAPDGRITASTLTNMLLTWLLSEDTPSIILVNGTAVGLNKQCLTQLNSLTRNACIEVFSSDALEAFTTTTKVTDSPKSSLFTVVGFFGGLVAGILVTVIIIALIICVMKLRVYVARAQPVETAKRADIPMGTNEAYESVEPRYQAGGMQEDEVIYELPA